MDSINNVKIGHKLRELRKERGMSIQDLAEQTNIAISSISRIENDKVNPNLLTILRIIEYFEISVEELIKEL